MKLTLSQAGQGQLPLHSALRKTIRRVRVKAAAAPPASVSLKTLQIPEEYSTYQDANGQVEPFLLADSEADRERILIFGRQANLDLLTQSTHWFMDGTFRVAPALFGQMFCILAERYGAVHPVAYALLSNKS